MAERFYEIAELVTGGRTTLGLTLMALVLVLWGAGMVIWLRRYARVAGYRNVRRRMPRMVDGISVVVILSDDFHYLEHTLPRIMGQQYPDFELVAIDVNSCPEFADELDAQKARYPNLVTARLDPDPRFRISNKMIYNVGIKTARYNSVILTTSDAYPTSSGWLAAMSKGFANGEVVISYCGVEHGRGVGNAMIRCGRMMTGVRYLAAAVAGRPYRGVLQNLGFDKQLYLENRGFNHLDMTVGEDDLFVQKIATRDNICVIMNRNATMQQTIHGGLAGWWRMRRLLGTTRSFYTARARRATTTELVLRFMLLLSVAVCAMFLPLYTALGAVVLWLARMLVVRHQITRISRRLGERAIGRWMLLYDPIEPFICISLFVSRIICKPKANWK
ncbi:MAG: glycosyltransferase [Rikenellaceae bacterium]|nr:glycosyltransferase [Rikenellaceae bacterium]MCL2692934.1 glycosyltransferase [Rikenellaceae bacterium]